MYRLFFTPEWFNGWDLVFDTVSLLIAFLIAAYSWQIYRIHKEKRFGYFSLAFILVTLGLVFKIITQGVLYFTTVRDVAADILRPIAGERLSLSYLYYRGGFFVEMVFLLGAWLLIYLVSQKPRERLKRFDEVTQIALFMYLIVLISIVSNFEYYVFYLTSAVFLGLIILNYYRNYLNKENINTFRVMLSFLFVFMGNLFFVFVFAWNGFYALGELFQLIGFLLLLYTYQKVIQR